MVAHGRAQREGHRSRPLGSDPPPLARAAPPAALSSCWGARQGPLLQPEPDAQQFATLADRCCLGPAPDTPPLRRSSPSRRRIRLSASHRIRVRPVQATAAPDEAAARALRAARRPREPLRIPASPVCEQNGVTSGGPTPGSRALSVANIALTRIRAMRGDLRGRQRRRRGRQRRRRGRGGDAIVRSAAQRRPPRGDPARRGRWHWSRLWGSEPSPLGPARRAAEAGERRRRGPDAVRRRRP